MKRPIAIETDIETKAQVKRVTAMSGMLIAASVVIGAILTWMVGGSL